jgi:hypothetical protein
MITARSFLNMEHIGSNWASECADANDGVRKSVPHRR